MVASRWWFLWLQPSLWMVTEDPASGCHGELCVSGSRVVWYEGLHPHNRTVRKVYSVESKILQAFWCQFREEGVSPSGGKSRREDQSLRCVCVREHSCLTFFMQTGAVHYIPLPFLVSEWVALQVDCHLSIFSICSSVIHPFSPPPISHQSLCNCIHRPDSDWRIVDYLLQNEILFWKWVVTLLFLPQVHRAWPISSGVQLDVWGWGGVGEMEGCTTCTSWLPRLSVKVWEMLEPWTFRAFAVPQSLFFLLPLHIQDILVHLSITHHSGSTMIIPKYLCPQPVCPVHPSHPPPHVNMILSNRKYTPVLAPGEVDR